MKFEAVLFDVGNTLLRVPVDPHQRAIAKAAHLGEIPFEAYKSSLAQARQEWWSSSGRPELQDLPETWMSHIQRALELIQFSGDAGLASRLIEESYLLDGWENYAESVEVLETLRARGFRLGIVSNWPPSLEQTLELAGLRQYFEAIVVSGIEGYAKPHPAIFIAALERLQSDPRSTLYVGDSPKHDVEGPAAVGMPSVLIDRERSTSGEHATIESLRGLLDLLPLNSLARRGTDCTFR